MILYWLYTRKPYTILSSIYLFLPFKEGTILYLFLVVISCINLGLLNNQAKVGVIYFWRSNSFPNGYRYKWFKPWLRHHDKVHTLLLPLSEQPQVLVHQLCEEGGVRRHHSDHGEQHCEQGSQSLLTILSSCLPLVRNNNILIYFAKWFTGLKIL